LKVEEEARAAAVPSNDQASKPVEKGKKPDKVYCALNSTQQLQLLHVVEALILLHIENQSCLVAFAQCERQCPTLLIGPYAL